jgi:glycosyltransferase involved in cell wall biosynthesis
MRILQIHAQYRQLGGEETVVAAERAMLEAAGHAVDTWRIENPDGTLLAARDFALAAWNPLRARALRSHCEAMAPDVVHVHNTWFAASPSVIAAAAGTGVPVVMTLHNYRLVCANGEMLRDGRPCEVCVGRGPWSAVRYGCYRRSHTASVMAAATISVGRHSGVWSDGVARFGALTRFAAQRMVAGGLPGEKVAVLPHVVEDLGVRPAPPSCSDTVLYVGRLTAAKGVPTLVRAWSARPPAGLKLRIIGTGPAADEIAAIDAPGVELVGRVDRQRVRQEMYGARALMFPSEWYEGMPMTLLEAFSCGLPVLGSDIGSVAEIVGGVGSEWLVPPRDRHAWGEAFTRLLDDAFVDRGARGARRIYETTHTPRAGLERLERFYRRAT